MKALILLAELRLSFVLGYTATEFATTLSLISSRGVDPTPLITDVVPLADSVAAFDRLSRPIDSMKILVGET